MSLTYGSVCSGIEAATSAWHPLGWRPQFFSELADAPRAVLAHHYPEVPLHGDFTTIQAGQYGPIQLLVGGTPCQSFSLAGLRGGLADDRGNLALQFLRLADRLRPRWLVWENVPGVLSSSGGRDFGAILGGMVELGYGFAYRVLDAQYVRVDGYGRAVPQRRRRVFVVGHLGDWRRPAAVLLERASLRGDPAPRRGAAAGASSRIANGPGGGRFEAGWTKAGRAAAQAFGGGQNCKPTDVSTALTAHPGGRYDLQNETFIAEPVCGTIGGTSPGGGWRLGPDEAAAGQLVAQTLRARDGAKGVDSDCTDTLISVSGALSCGDRGVSPDQAAAGMIVPVAFNSRQDPDVTWDRTGALGSSAPQAEAVAVGRAVRRLTPTECERLQGFPDGHTAVPWRGGILSDGPRYKALGNSMAVNVMRWIGRRIEAVEAA